MRKILFLSSMDFTSKGIQVIQLTPEFLSRKGFKVVYAIVRDESIGSSYYYQKRYQPEGVIVHRKSIREIKIIANLKWHLLRSIINKLKGYYAIINLVVMGRKIIESENINLIYGSGPHGVLAAFLLRIINRKRRIKVISRFYGVWDLYSDWIVNKNWIKVLLNWDVVLALKIKSDLTIITNDGTMGDKALIRLRGNNLGNYKFYVNGVNDYKLNEEKINKLVKELNLENKVVGICVSRLVSLKRVDRCIDITNAIVNKYKVKNFVLLVAGDGVELQRLMDQVRELNIAENVIFLGAVENHDIYSYLSISQFFISMYAVSNVGNPMLEAIKSKKVIFTLNNGDTSRWICHKKNGYIYDENSDFIDKVACDIVELIAQPYRVKLIAQQIEITSNSLLYDWDTRLSMEFDDIVLLNDSNKGVI